ncbi:filamentous haemagglutinin family protein [Methylomagnum ishizawai]|uniref:filamentous haemagglutinin family protein n=1 Tax=Methylomagnum ishizawai TaxID=1760988 RepID=UPI001C32ED55|nr:filamentous haemagglutinin family protein [Methylomagnum ishizawai]BBL77058.1 hypothetical protein MishRS11D_41560 [Methylomagnum ishizawai]
MSSKRLRRAAVRLPHKKPLAEAIGSLILGGVAIGSAPARAELPVPSSVLVAPGHGRVLGPVIKGGTMTIKQLSDKAILDWESFNIGKDNAVRFSQPSATAIALNNIHQSDPSRILGSLTANGQVYLVNQNGFMFGKDARVDTNTLVVSTLKISEDTLNGGLSRAINTNGAAALDGGNGLYLKDAQGNPVKDAQGDPVKIGVTIEKGAQLTTQDGGRILIAAPNIVNKGDIKTPGGQAILAASSDKVYLQEADSQTTGVRGLLVEVATGGKVQNLGKIAARRGNVTLEGFAVNQEGLVSATTSVRLNGSIRLLAREKGDNPVIQEPGTSTYKLLPDRTGRDTALDDGLGKQARVVLGQGSTTQVVPDKGRQKAVDEQTQDPSRIEIMGKQIALLESSKVYAPSGKIALTATTSPADPTTGSSSDPNVSIDLKLGATVDAAGLKNVKVPMAKNVVQVELRSFELRDAPMQKDKKGALYGKKVLVDIREAQDGRIGSDGNTIDISGGIARIQRNIAERSVKGGSVSLASGGSVNIGPDAKVDVSGGYTHYNSGYVKTTWLKSQDKLYEIGSADLGRHYDSIAGRYTQTDKRWGVTRSWFLLGPGNQGRYEKGYDQGADGGQLDISATQLDLQGDLRGGTVDGLHQRESGQRAAGASLNIDLGLSPLGVQSVAVLGQNGDLDAQLQRLSAGLGGAVLTNPLVLMDRYLERTGFRSTTVVSRGAVGVSDLAEVNLPAEGSLTLQGGQVEFEGHIRAPSGTVALKTQFDEGVPDFGTTGKVHLAPGSSIDVSGAWTNDLTNKQGGKKLPLKAAPVDGGTVNLLADGDLGFDKDAEIAADAGAWLDSGGKLTNGKGGSISLAATDTGRNPDVAISGRNGSNLELNGDLHAYAQTQGGSLSLATNQILIGDSFSAYQTAGNGLQPLVLAPGFFNGGGFADYALTSNLNGIAVGYDTHIDLKAQNFAFNDSYQQAPTGTPIQSLGGPRTLTDDLRQPVNLSLTLKQPANTYSTQVGIVLDPGSSIAADPGAKIAIHTDSKAVLDGRISAPAGSLVVDVNSPQQIAYDAAQGIFVGKTATLSAAGAVVPVPGVNNGVNDKDVLAGGSISLSANRGYVVLEPGSVLDVSGTSAVVGESRPDPNGAGYRLVPTVHASDAGSIALNAAEGVLIGGDIQGRSDRAHGARGGDLSISLLTSLRNPPDDVNLAKTFPAGPRTIQITQDQPTDPLADWTPGTAVPDSVNGLATLSANRLAAGGFDGLTLKAENAVRFVGDVTLATGSRIVLDTPTLALAQAEGQTASSVVMDTPYLELGSSLVRDQTSATLPDSTGGAGTLSANARNIDLLGGLSLQGIGDTRLVSAQDLRLRGVNLPQTRDFIGTLLASGNLTLAAQQIYPATLSQYAIKLTGDASNTLTVLGGSGKPAPILAAGGGIEMTAPNIDVGGVVKAPFGSIKLEATANGLNLGNGAVVSVSADGQTIPFGQTQGGQDWLYPIGSGINLLYGVGTGEQAPPTGSIQLSGARVNVASGAKIDISGGGQLWSHEFVKGGGGSLDLLDPQDPEVVNGDFQYQEKYAILPWLKDRIAPYDPIETPKSGLGVGDSIYLADSAAGLKAGRYTLLPASYALLPGAYLITTTSGTANTQPGAVARRADGVAVVAGQRAEAGTGFQSYQWEGFAVQRGRDFKKLTDYTISTADKFFAAQAKKLDVAVPQLPRDAGKLTLEVGNQLSLDGTVSGQAAQGGHGGELDIAANNLRVVAPTSATTGNDDEVVLRADQLDKLNVDSLLLGGVRSAVGKDETHIATQSGAVVVDPGAELKGPEIMLTANDRIDIRAGAKLQAQGELNSGTQTLTLSNSDGSASDGAFVRVSAAGQADIVRANPAQTQGTLNIEAGAVLGASGSMALDSTRAASFAGSIDMKGGSLSLGANRIDLGAAGGDGSGLGLTGSQLAGFTVDELILRSGSEIRTYGEIALTAKKLDIEASGLAGYGDAQASLSADQITLANPGAGQFTASGDQGGSLAIDAKDFSFGGGQFAIAGYKTIQLQAANQFTASGQGKLSVAGDTTLATPVATAANGADFTLDAGGHALAFNALASGSAATAGLGAKYTLVADSIALSNKILLPSGDFIANAGHGLNLAGGASLDVSGISQVYTEKTVYTPGGNIALNSAQGDVNLAAGATIDVSGAEQAGSFSLAAPAGGASLQATFKGAATQAGGSNASLAFDLGRNTDQGAGAFAYLQSTGGARDFSLRLRQGDLAVADGAVLKSHSFELAADSGDVIVAGTLDASGQQAGSIALAAGDRVRLASSAKLLAGTSTVNAQGGSVFLEAVDRDGDGQSGIVAAAGAVIDVRGGALQNPVATPDVDQVRYITDGPTVRDGASGIDYLAGSIHLRALRDSLGDGSDVLGVDFKATASGATQVVAEAVRVYDLAVDPKTNTASIGADQIAAWSADTQAYMAALDPKAHPGLSLLPGLEIRSAGNLTLASDWDFRTVRWLDTDGNETDPSVGTPVPTNDWRYGSNHDVPGFLTLRAQGDVLLQGKLSDGIAAGQITDDSDQPAYISELIQSGPSWSFRVVAGAEAGAASAGQTRTGVGDLEIAKNALIRTGTGDIELHAGKDFKLDDATSAVYTVGSVSSDPARRYGVFTNVDVWNFYAEYPTGGGNIAIAAGGDIIGATTSQFVPDWLVRTGNWTPGSDHNGESKVAWGIALTQPDAILQNNLYNFDPDYLGFQQNVGALAGGRVNIAAGGNIADLSAVVSTVGQQVGTGERNSVDIHNGGSLDIKAGGNIAGGMYYVGKGTANVDAEGAITGGAQYTDGPLFSLGDTQYKVSARTDIAVGAVFDPFMLRERFTTGTDSDFSTYSAASAVAFSALAGDISFNNALAVFNKNYLYPGSPSPVLTFDVGDVQGGNFTGGDYIGLYYYPGTVTAQANAGSIGIMRSFNMAPAAEGNLELFAGNAIQSGDNGNALVTVNMTDTDPAFIPGPLNPTTPGNLGDFQFRTSPVGGSIDQIHAAVPVHSGDSEPVRIASLSGNIQGFDPLEFYLPKSARIESGGDVRDVSFEIQNLDSKDISEISAKGDIAFAIKRDENGALVAGQVTRFRISGPGSMQMLAGGNIDLGSSDGLVSFGDTLNPALPSTGASLSLLAGLSDQLDTAGFLKTYLKMSDAEIGALSARQQLDLVLPVLFDVVRKAGVDAAKHGKKGYEPGFKAIQALFTGDQYQGDINLFFSRVHTIAGGDINLLAPGGTINAGLTNSALGSKTTADLGIVVQQKGAINAIAKNDFTVNESRVFTQGGGDITIWSSDGNIDAGKGAKSALSAPPTQSTFDDKGNLVVVFPPVLSGSGIRTAISDPKQAAGDVYLFAPRGVVDAGEAGIGGNNVVIAATAVIGASNIQVSGTSVGVPTTPPPPVVPAGAASAAAAAANSASQQLNENSAEENAAAAKQKADALASTLMKSIMVDVVGFGDCTTEEVRRGKEGCGG